MASSILRLISRKAAARSPNLLGGRGARISTRSLSDESVLCPSSLPSRISPWLMLPRAFEGGNMVYKFYSLAENKVLSVNKRGDGGGEEESELPNDDAKLVGSSHGWLALFNERSCDLFLSNPLTRRHIKLPPVLTLPIPKIHLRRGCVSVSKAIISCSPDEEDCRAMMTYGPQNRLAFCCPGRSTEWSALFHGRMRIAERSYEDFVYSSRQKLFFCVSEIDEIEKLELKELSWPLNNLVFAEQSNELFYVRRFVMEQMDEDGSYVEDIFDSSYPYKTMGFDVFKIDREAGELRYMNGSLDGLAMFIGSNHSFAMPAAEFPELKPNSIYFTDVAHQWMFDIDNENFGGHDLGIFNYQDRTFSPCYYPCDVQSIKRIMPPPMWFTPAPI
ncbi:hypothetical protein Pfo_007544 [Paulownia fortunei]|nr:hypothetical protein Pfo_007544 [Paulownia fortunei]